MEVIITLIDLKALPIGTFYFFYIVYTLSSLGIRIFNGIIETKKKIAIIKKGTEYPKIEFSIEPTIGPNSNPKAVIVSIIANFF